MSIFEVLKAVGKVVENVATLPTWWNLDMERESNMNELLDLRHLTELRHSFGTKDGKVGDAEAQGYSIQFEDIQEFDYLVETKSGSPNSTQMSTTDFLFYLRQEGYTKQTTYYTLSFGEKLDVHLLVMDQSDKGQWCLRGDFSHIVGKEANSILYTSKEINDILDHYHQQYGGVTSRMETMSFWEDDEPDDEIDEEPNKH